MPFIGQNPSVGGYNILDDITIGSNTNGPFNLLLNGSAFSPESANHLLVSVNGVIQKPGSSFTISGSQITFVPSSGTLSSSDSIDFIMALGNVLDVGTPTDGTVSENKIVNNAVTSAKLDTNAVTSAKLDTNIAVSGNLDVGGKLTPAKISQSVAFQVSALDTDISYTASNGIQKITGWDTTELNVGNCWSNANQRFTPTVAGWYMFGGSIRGNFTSILTAISIEINKNGIVNNGTGLKTQIQYSGGDIITNGEYAAPTGLLFCNGSTDYVEIFFDADENCTLHDTASRKSHFFGFLVHAT